MPYKVLLVDDEPLVTEALKRALRKEAYEVSIACSAHQALEILAREKFDVVVSDEMMPGMSGSDFLGIVFARHPETIRIILTGHPRLDSALRAINKGQVFRFLIKPCSGVELDFTIKQAIKHRELSRKSHGLLETVRRQRAMLGMLEAQYPGITKVDVNMEGTINISDEEYDLDALMEEMKKELELDGKQKTEDGGLKTEDGMDTLKRATTREFMVRPIGFIKSPITDRADAPCQGSESSVVGDLVVDEAYGEALLGLEPGRKIVILYWMHRAERGVLQVHPRRDQSRPLRGVFSTRSPDRPNPIALDTVEILEINGTVLKVRGLDAIDNTPLIDIKSAG